VVGLPFLVQAFLAAGLTVPADKRSGFWQRQPAPNAPPAAETPPDDLVFVHVPYNFGQTISRVAAFGHGQSARDAYTSVHSNLSTVSSRRAFLEANVQPGGRVWGPVHPELLEISAVTGCNIDLTPPKYWPRELAARYFGDQQVFGMLRDPFERLVAQFRGPILPGKQFIESCDVNAAVRAMLEEYKRDPFALNCQLVPQAEWFDAPYPISVVGDVRRFPASVNEIFAAHNSSMLIHRDDIAHVRLCTEVWAGDMDCETRALVREVYARDFALLCNHFGYCDMDETCCIQGVPTMCPRYLEARRQTAYHCPDRLSNGTLLHPAGQQAAGTKSTGASPHAAARQAAWCGHLVWVLVALGHYLGGVRPQ